MKEETVDDVIALNNYKLTADKIVQLLSQIHENPSNSAKRWVWELLQNAKDVPNKYGKVSIEIELKSDKELQFRHNGDVFSINNITGLVQQVSSKDSQNSDGQTGKFGTGFICTHLISDIIEVSGIAKYQGKFYNFSIALDRSSEKSEELLPHIKETLEELRKMPYPQINNYEKNRTENSFDTRFTYHLSTKEKYHSAIAGLNDLVNTLPLALVTQYQKIKQVRVINRIDNTDILYTCHSKEIEKNKKNIICSTIHIGKKQKYYISYITEEVVLTTEIQSDDKPYFLVKRDNEQPVLYRDFPLIGSEKFYFPYFLNGFNFNPTERRNGILLNSEDSKSAQKNRTIIEDAVYAVLDFNQWLIRHNVQNRYLMVASRIPESSEKFDENTALPWIKNLQKLWRKSLLEQELVETPNGFDLLKNLSLPCFSQNKKENETFFELVAENYIGEGVLPKFEHLQGWLDVIRPEYEAWGAKLKYEKEDFLKDLSNLQTLSSLASRIGKTREEAISWLNKVYKFLVGQNMLNEFDKYAIIPNQRGELKNLNELKSDAYSIIPPQLKTIYNSVNPNAPIEIELIDNDIDASIFGNNIKSFGQKEMIGILNKFIKSNDKIIINGKKDWCSCIVMYQIISLYPQTKDKKYLSYRKEMYDLSKAYRKNMPEYTKIHLDNLELWKEADEEWFGGGLDEYENVSKLASDFFLSPKSEEENLVWINRYIQFYRNNAKGDLIKEQKIFPNQELELKTLSELHYDNAIDEEYKDLIEPIKEYRPLLLHRAIEGYEQHSPLSTKGIYEEIEKALEKNLSLQGQIASQAIALLPEDKEDAEKEQFTKLYKFAKQLFGNAIPEQHSVATSTGFKWGFAQEYFMKKIAKKISTSENIENLKNILAIKEDADVIEWVDSFIEFTYTFKNKRYWKFITDKECGKGIWLNQNNDFCKFQDVSRDEGIPEGLKDIAKNEWVNKDFREELFNTKSRSSHYIEKSISIQDVGKYIDDKISEYDGNKQDKDFASLVFGIRKLCEKIPDLQKIMKKYSEKKNALIVGSLGEGKTMEIVGELIQQGEDKLELALKLIEDKSTEYIQKLLQGKVSLNLPSISKTLSGNVAISIGSPNDVDENDKEELNKEAKNIIQERLERKGYSFGSNWNYNITEITTPDGNSIQLVAKSCRTGKLNLNPLEWEALLQPESMLWVFDGRKTFPLHLRSIIRGQEKLILSMNTENLDKVNMISKFADTLKYFKQIHFLFDDIRPTKDFYESYDFDARPRNEKPTKTNDDEFLG